jgi:DNA-binding transcriptional LysR family regulator
MKTLADSGEPGDAQVRGEAPSGDVMKMHRVGRPGRGMSVLAEYMVLEDLRHGRPVVVLDPRGRLFEETDSDGSG